MERHPKSRSPHSAVARCESRPLRLKCAGAGDTPSLSKIHRLVKDNRHLVLEFTLPPPAAATPEDTGAQAADSGGGTFDKRSLIRQLAGVLPEYSVFDSGGRVGGIEQVTITKVVARQAVLDNAGQIVAAARDFRMTAHDLMARLAQHLNVPLTEFYDGRYWPLLPNDGERGRLDDEWGYYFHGVECCFISRTSGQTLDVILEQENEFGVLDPYFFWQFVATTREWHDVARLLKHGYHDAARALEVLEAHGLLKRLAGSEPYRRCLVVADDVPTESIAPGL